MTITYKIASSEDIPQLIAFTDFWLAGRGTAVHAEGVVNDYWISPSQHRDYLRKYKVLVAIDSATIVGWAVCSKSKRLFHMLVAGTHRGKGIGSKMLKMLDPQTVRSKTDQASGDPTPWYIAHGFNRASVRLEGKKQNIAILTKGDPQNAQTA